MDSRGRRWIIFAYLLAFCGLFVGQLVQYRALSAGIAVSRDIYAALDSAKAATAVQRETSREVNAHIAAAVDTLLEQNRALALQTRRAASRNSALNRALVRRLSRLVRADVRHVHSAIDSLRPTHAKQHRGP